MPMTCPDSPSPGRRRRASARRLPFGTIASRFGACAPIRATRRSARRRVGDCMRPARTRGNGFGSTRRSVPVSRWAVDHCGASRTGVAWRDGTDRDERCGCWCPWLDDLLTQARHGPLPRPPATRRLREPPGGVADADHRACGPGSVSTGEAPTVKSRSLNANSSRFCRHSRATSGVHTWSKSFKSPLLANASKP